MAPDAGRKRCLVGLIGADIATSLSPQLHEREADELGLRYFYQLIDIARLGLEVGDVGALLRDARRMGFRGLNITHPCKQAVVPYLDGLSPAAAALDAVNTVEFTGGRMIGHNTDLSGFQAALASGLPGVRMRHVVILGAGGAGSAVAHAVLRLGAQRLTVADVVPSRADGLAASLRIQFGLDSVRAGDPAGLEAVLADADGLVNATPVGMELRTGMPVAGHLLRPGMWVADIVYRPLQTELLRQARGLGCQTLPGSGMLVFQAADAFRLFTGQVPDTERMLSHLASLTGTPEHALLPGHGVSRPDDGQGSRVPGR
ncbi:MAG TPA: shikimate dehydrogenase [Streptosporangiaceae bacterium]|jgi:shikimate dehydrogenase